MLKHIFETHAHYDDEAFDEDREILLNSMADAGIDTIINVGASLSSIRRTLELMDTYPFVYGAIGVHPSDCAPLTDADLDWMEDMCRLDKAVAVGEIGLDYHWDEPDRDIQKHWFTRQLLLAKKVDLPVIIHSREAALDTITLMKDAGADNHRGVIHCYSYSKETAREFLSWGYYFGIGGVVTFKNAKKLKEVVEYLPLENIVLETDSPYMAPVPNRGKRNSSLNLPYVAEQIAAIKGIDAQKVVDVTRQNAMKLFSKVR